MSALESSYETLPKSRIYRYLKLVSEIWSNRDASVVIGGWADGESLFAALACILLGRRWGLWVGLVSLPQVKSWRILIKKWLIHHAHFVVCYHARTAKVLRQMTDRLPPLHVGWNVGDVAKVSLLAERWEDRGDIAQSPRRLCFIGSLDNRKGVDLLLELASREILPCGLDLIGEGPFLAMAKEIESVIGCERLKVHGFLEGDSLHEILANADALVLPTRYDVGAIVLSEALAAGMQVIVSDADGGLDDYLGRTPDYLHVFQADDANSLLEAIVTWYASPRPLRADIRRTFLRLDPIGVYAGAFVGAAERT